MKFFLFVSLMSLSSFVMAVQEWKVIAETTSCNGKIQILAKKGEKFVVARKGEQKTKLFSKDGSAYTEQALKMTEFASADNAVTYTQPSYVENNLPKIDVGEKRCKLNFTR